MQQLMSIAPPVEDGHDASSTLSDGGLLVESWWAPGCVTFMLSGTLRTDDRYLLVDAITGALLVGARHVQIECSGLESAAVTALIGLAQVRRFTDGTGGSFRLTGLRLELESVWCTLDASSHRPEDEMRSREVRRVDEVDGCVRAAQS